MTAAPLSSYTLGLNPATATTDVAEFEAALQAAADQRDGAERALMLARAVERTARRLTALDRLVTQLAADVTALAQHLGADGETPEGTEDDQVPRQEPAGRLPIFRGSNGTG